MARGGEAAAPKGPFLHSKRGAGGGGDAAGAGAPQVGALWPRSRGRSPRRRRRRRLLLPAARRGRTGPWPLPGARSQPRRGAAAAGPACPPPEPRGRQKAPGEPDGCGAVASPKGTVPGGLPLSNDLFLKVLVLSVTDLKENALIFRQIKSPNFCICFAA